jgi:hypothetical protein
VNAPGLLFAVEVQVELVEGVQPRGLHAAHRPTNAECPVIAWPTMSELISRVPSYE